MSQKSGRTQLGSPCVGCLMRLQSDVGWAADIGQFSLAGHLWWLTHIAGSQCCQWEPRWGCQLWCQHVASPARWSQGSKISSPHFLQSKSSKRTRQNDYRLTNHRASLLPRGFKKSQSTQIKRGHRSYFLVRTVARPHCRRACGVEDGVVATFDK